MDCKSRGIDPYKVDRSCGFLKKSERKLLLGQSEDISDSYASTLRHQIRTRTKHSLADFYLLSEHLPEKEKQKLMDIQPNSDVFVTDSEVAEEITKGPLSFIADLTLGEENRRYLFDRLDTYDDMMQEGDLIDDESVKEWHRTLIEQEGFTKAKLMRLIQNL